MELKNISLACTVEKHFHKVAIETMKTWKHTIKRQHFLKILQSMQFFNADIFFLVLWFKFPFCPVPSLFICSVFIAELGPVFKSCHCCVDACDVCGKVCIFTCLVNVPLLNVHIKGHRELKYVEFVVHFVPDVNILSKG